MRAGLLALAVWLLAAAPAGAAPALVKVGDFAGPTYVTAPPGDASRLFVTERAGTIRVSDGGVVQAQPFLDLHAGVDSASEERGLLSMAFAPDYAASGRFYVYLTRAGDGAVEIREYRRSANPDLADPATARTLVTIPHGDAANHNGGQLQFGPDGRLYAGTGDGGGANDQYHHAQDPASRLGKLLRLDATSGAAPEILARGLRNPWRFSFDRRTGELVIADVGQDAVEEVDVGLSANYGWPCLEGVHAHGTDPGCAGATAPPVLERPHASGACSITGGYVVRDPGLPTLLGRYLYGDFCAPELRSVDLTNPAGDTGTGLTVASLSSFGEDACGRLLAVSLAGPVYRIVDGATSPCVLGAAPGAPPVAADTRPCALSARVSGLRSVRRRHRIIVALRADEACRATVTARIRGVASFRTATRALSANRRAALTLRLPRRGIAAVRRHRRLRLVVSVSAADAAGNLRTLTRTARIRA